MSTASQIAAYIIAFFQEREDPITNLKLQKLLYYVQGWHLGLHGTPLFGEPLQAWVHGPVQPSVYQEYRGYRWNPISEPVPAPTLDAQLAKHVTDVLDVYGPDSAYALERRTHTEIPWLAARGTLPRDAESVSEISHDSMKTFFAGLAHEVDSEA